MKIYIIYCFDQTTLEEEKILETNKEYKAYYLLNTLEGKKHFKLSKLDFFKKTYRLEIKDI